MCAFYLFVLNLFRNGTIGLCTWSADLFFSDSSDLDGVELEEVDACVSLLGKVPLGLSIYELANWFIWTSNLVMVCV